MGSGRLPLSRHLVVDIFRHLGAGLSTAGVERAMERRVARNTVSDYACRLGGMDVVRERLAAGESAERLADEAGMPRPKVRPQRMIRGPAGSRKNGRPGVSLALRIEAFRLLATGLSTTGVQCAMAGGIHRNTISSVAAPLGGIVALRARLAAGESPEALAAACGDDSNASPLSHDYRIDIETRLAIVGGIAAGKTVATIAKESRGSLDRRTIRALLESLGGPAGLLEAIADGATADALVLAMYGDSPVPAKDVRTLICFAVNACPTCGGAGVCAEKAEMSAAEYEARRDAGEDIRVGSVVFEGDDGDERPAA